MCDCYRLFPLTNHHLSVLIIRTCTQKKRLRAGESYRSSDKVCWWRTQRGISRMHLSNYNNVPAQVNHNRSTKLRAAPSPCNKPSRFPLHPPSHPESFPPHSFSSVRKDTHSRPIMCGDACLVMRDMRCGLPIIERNSRNDSPTG